MEFYYSNSFSNDELFDCLRGEMDKDKLISIWLITKKMAHYINSYKKWVFLSAVASILKVVIDILMAYLIQNLIEVAKHGQEVQIKKYILWMITLAVIGILVNLICRCSSGRFSMYALRKIFEEIVYRIENMQMTKADELKCGDITSRIAIDMNRIQTFLEVDLIDFCYQPLILFCAITYLWLLNAKLL